MRNDVNIVPVVRIWPVPIFLLVDGVIAGTISALAGDVDDNRNGGYRRPIINDRPGSVTENSGLGICLSFFERRAWRCWGCGRRVQEIDIRSWGMGSARLFLGRSAEEQPCVQLILQTRFPKNILIGTLCAEVVF